MGCHVKSPGFQASCCFLAPFPNSTLVNSTNVRIGVRHGQEAAEGRLLRRAVYGAGAGRRGGGRAERVAGGGRAAQGAHPPRGGGERQARRRYARGGGAG